MNFIVVRNLYVNYSLTL